MSISNLSESGTGRFVATAASGLLKFAGILAIGAVAALLLFTLFILNREQKWLAAQPASPQQTVDERNERAFFQGTIGTEIVPLPVMKVLPDLCADPDGRASHFYPFGKEAGAWSEQFGFLPSKLLPDRLHIDDVCRDLPLGFTVSHYRPKSGAPSPVAYVGLTCAACHTTCINGKLVIGTGNASLNLFAWIDAFQASIHDKRVSYQALVDAYAKKPDCAALSTEERFFVWLWLFGARAKLASDATRFDEPFGNGLSMRPQYVPTGPCRTQPFRTLVRLLLQRPGDDLRVYTKIAAIYEEKIDQWGQFDGSIKGLYRRSAAAALAAGATPENMRLTEIANNIRWASDFISQRKGPSWNEIFPEQPVDPNSKAVKAGKLVYLEHCDRCHGHREQDRWVPGPLEGQLTELNDINTDAERVTFHHFEEVPDALSAYFPAEHPFDFPRETLRPVRPAKPGDAVQRGYINKPMHSMFTRAPFLHNGSVLTLAELIHLEERKPVFFRGANEYDVKTVGLKSPREQEHDPQDRTLYFRFDTSLPGNSNAGHDYPWSRREVAENPGKRKQLQSLLDYLKTL